jgi:ribosome-binding factor A
VGKRLGLRHTPSVAFFLDAVPDTANHIEELLAKARVADAEVARTAATARPAGDADPYKRREDEADDDQP